MRRIRRNGGDARHVGGKRSSFTEFGGKACS